MLLRPMTYFLFGLLLTSCVWRQQDGAIVPSKRPRQEAVATHDPALALLPVDDLREDLVMRQRVTVRWADREESFDAVLQKREGALVLLGLGPMNTVGFSLTLDDRGITFDNRSGRAMPFQPERILADVQRAFYPWIADDSRCVNCERRELRAGLEVRERIGIQFLEERSFRITDRPDRGDVVIRYEGWTKDGLAPARTILRNGWFGYWLTIDTDSVELIE